jgi:hypothetical protein
MRNPQMKNASGQAGVSVVGGQAKATKQKKAIYCGSNHIKKRMQEIRRAKLQLRSTASDTQAETLPKVLQYFGARGLNTFEGQAAGYLRIATRIKELQDIYEIASLREDVIGPDGLFHKGVARYVLIGKRKDLPPAQQCFDLEGA